MLRGIHKLIDKSQWDEVRSQIDGSNNPAHASLSRPSGRGNWTPLHLALKRHAPIDIILSFVELAPQSASMVDDNHRLPLHYAAEFYPGTETTETNSPSSSVTDIFQLLTSAHPPGVTAIDNNGMTPLHIRLSQTHSLPSRDEIELLLDEEGVVARTVSSTDGSLPLHLLCDGVGRHEGCLEVIRVIVRAFVAGVVEKDAEGRTPMHRALLSCSDCGVMDEEVLNILMVVEDVLEVRDNEGRLPLHVACMNVGSVGTAAVEDILERYPAGAGVRANDGKFPLEMLEIMREEVEEEKKEEDDDDDSNGGRDVIEDLNRVSDQLFVYYPDIMPYRRQVKRLERLAMNLCEEVYETGELSQMSDLFWSWICTAQDSETEADGLGDLYYATVASTLQCLDKESSRMLTGLPYSSITADNDANENIPSLMEMATPEVLSLFKSFMRFADKYVIDDEEMHKLASKQPVVSIIATVQDEPKDTDDEEDDPWKNVLIKFMSNKAQFEQERQRYAQFGSMNKSVVQLLDNYNVDRKGTDDETDGDVAFARDIESTSKDHVSLYRYAVVTEHYTLTLEDVLVSFGGDMSMVKRCMRSVGKVMQALHKQGFAMGDFMTSSLVSINDAHEFALSNLSSAISLSSSRSDTRTLVSVVSCFRTGHLPPEMIVRMSEEECAKYLHYWKAVSDDASTIKLLLPSDVALLQRHVDSYLGEAETITYDALHNRMRSHASMWNIIQPRLYEGYYYAPKCFVNNRMYNGGHKATMSPNVLPYSLIRHSPLIDTWRYSLLVYELCSSGRTFWHVNADKHIVTPQELAMLYAWEDQGFITEKLTTVSDPLARDLLRKMMVKQDKRPTVGDMLDHPFFGEWGDSEDGDELLRQASQQIAIEEERMVKEAAEKKKQLEDEEIRKKEDEIRKKEEEEKVRIRELEKIDKERANLKAERNRIQQELEDEENRIKAEQEEEERRIQQELEDEELRIKEELEDEEARIRQELEEKLDVIKAEETKIKELKEKLEEEKISVQNELEKEKETVEEEKIRVQKELEKEKETFQKDLEKEKETFQKDLEKEKETFQKELEKEKETFQKGLEKEKEMFEEYKITYQKELEREKETLEEENILSQQELERDKEMLEEEKILFQKELEKEKETLEEEKKKLQEEKISIQKELEAMEEDKQRMRVEQDDIEDTMLKLREDKNEFEIKQKEREENLRNEISLKEKDLEVEHEERTKRLEHEWTQQEQKLRAEMEEREYTLKRELDEDEMRIGKEFDEKEYRLKRELEEEELRIEKEFEEKEYQLKRRFEERENELTSELKEREVRLRKDIDEEKAQIKQDFEEKKKELEEQQRQMEVREETLKKERQDEIQGLLMDLEERASGFKKEREEREAEWIAEMEEKETRLKRELEEREVAMKRAIEEREIKLKTDIEEREVQLKKQLEEESQRLASEREERILKMTTELETQQQSFRTMKDEFLLEQTQWHREQEDTATRREKEFKERECRLIADFEKEEAKLRFELNQELDEKEIALKKEISDEERRIKVEQDEALQEMRKERMELEERELSYKRKMEEKEIQLKREMEEKEINMMRDLENKTREMKQNLEEEHKRLAQREKAIEDAERRSKDSQEECLLKISASKEEEERRLREWEDTLRMEMGEERERMRAELREEERQLRDELEEERERLISEQEENELKIMDLEERLKEEYNQKHAAMSAELEEKHMYLKGEIDIDREKILKELQEEQQKLKKLEQDFNTELEEQKQKFKEEMEIEEGRMKAKQAALDDEQRKLEEEYAEKVAKLREEEMRLVEELEEEEERMKKEFEDQKMRQMEEDEHVKRELEKEEHRLKREIEEEEARLIGELAEEEKRLRMELEEEEARIRSELEEEEMRIKQVQEEEELRINCELEEEENRIRNEQEEREMKLREEEHRVMKLIDEKEMSMKKQLVEEKRKLMEEVHILKQRVLEREDMAKRQLAEEEMKMFEESEQEEARIKEEEEEMRAKFEEEAARLEAERKKLKDEEERRKCELQSLKEQQEMELKERDRQLKQEQDDEAQRIKQELEDEAAKIQRELEDEASKIKSEQEKERRCLDQRADEIEDMKRDIEDMKRHLEEALEAAREEAEASRRAREEREQMWREEDEREQSRRAMMEETELKEREEREARWRMEAEKEREEEREKLIVVKNNEKEWRKKHEISASQLLALGDDNEALENKMARGTWRQWMDLSDAVMGRDESLYPTCYVMLPYKLITVDGVLCVPEGKVSMAETFGLLIGNAMHAVALLNDLYTAMEVRENEGDNSDTVDDNVPDDDSKASSVSSMSSKLSDYSKNRKILVNAETSFVDTCEGIITRASNAELMLAEILKEYGNKSIANPQRKAMIVVRSALADIMDYDIIDDVARGAQHAKDTLGDIFGKSEATSGVRNTVGSAMNGVDDYKSVVNERYESILGSDYCSEITSQRMDTERMLSGLIQDFVKDPCDAVKRILDGRMERLSEFLFSSSSPTASSQQPQELEFYIIDEITNRPVQSNVYPHTIDTMESMHIIPHLLSGMRLSIKGCCDSKNMVKELGTMLGLSLDQIPSEWSHFIECNLGSMDPKAAKKEYELFWESMVQLQTFKEVECAEDMSDSFNIYEEFLSSIDPDNEFGNIHRIPGTDNKVLWGTCDRRVKSDEMSCEEIFQKTKRGIEKFMHKKSESSTSTKSTKITLTAPKLISSGMSSTSEDEHMVLPRLTLSSNRFNIVVSKDDDLSVTQEILSIRTSVTLHSTAATGDEENECNRSNTGEDMPAADDDQSCLSKMSSSSRFRSSLRSTMKKREKQIAKTVVETQNDVDSMESSEASQDPNFIYRSPLPARTTYKQLGKSHGGASMNPSGTESKKVLRNVKVETTISTGVAKQNNFQKSITSSSPKSISSSSQKTSVSQKSTSNSLHASMSRAMSNSRSTGSKTPAPSSVPSPSNARSVDRLNMKMAMSNRQTTPAASKMKKLSVNSDLDNTSQQYMNSQSQDEDSSINLKRRLALSRSPRVATSKIASTPSSSAGAPQSHISSRTPKNDNANVNSLVKKSTSIGVMNKVPKLKPISTRSPSPAKALNSGRVTPLTTSYSMQISTGRTTPTAAADLRTRSASPARSVSYPASSSTPTNNASSKHRFTPRAGGGGAINSSVEKKTTSVVTKPSLSTNTRMRIDTFTSSTPTSRMRAPSPSLSSSVRGTIGTSTSTAMNHPMRSMKSRPSTTVSSRFVPPSPLQRSSGMMGRK